MRKILLLKENLVIDCRYYSTAAKESSMQTVSSLL